MKTFINLAKVEKNYREFKKRFGGLVFYAIKANPTPHIINKLHQAGIDGFDVASVHEMRTVSQVYDQANMLFTHPIKSRPEITSAYNDFAIRTYVIDSHSELLKLSQMIDLRTCEIMVRIKIPILGATSLQKLDDKFGIEPSEAAGLLRAVDSFGARAGVCFHVGSQQELENAHWLAVTYVAQLLEGLDVPLSALSIGGGFPARYDENSQRDFMQSIPSAHKIRSELPLFAQADIIAEPGRCLVADIAKSEVKVIAVDGRRVFIDDGVYGGLMDCGIAKMRFVISAKDKPADAQRSDFTIFGPTCDSLDTLPGQYSLPRDICEGDTLVVHNTGAYCNALTENFNGLVPQSTIEPFEEHETVIQDGNTILYQG